MLTNQLLLTVNQNENNFNCFFSFFFSIKFFQSKLNCEVLYDDLAFEVRWAVAGESIVVQLVAKLGKINIFFFSLKTLLLLLFSILDIDF